MNFITLQPPDGGYFKSLPEHLGFSSHEGHYYLNQSQQGALTEDEIERVRVALQRAAYRLINIECQGAA